MTSAIQRPIQIYMCISWNDHFLQVLTSASLFKVGESCFVIQKFDVTDSGNYPG